MEDELQLLRKELKEQRLIIDQHTETLKKIRRSMLWGTIFGFLRLLIIIVPFIIAFIYLPSLIDEFFSNFYGSGDGQGQQLQIPQGLDFADFQQYLER